MGLGIADYDVENREFIFGFLWVSQTRRGKGAQVERIEELNLAI
jgi:hypothetical protein